MNFGQLKTEVQNLRFDSSRATQIGNWINARYAAIWDLDDWYFKHVQAGTLSVLAGDSTPVVPSDFAKAEAIYDANEDEITYLAPDRFRSFYENSTVTGPADAYTVIGREVYIGPTPSANQTLTLSYIRRVSYVNASGSIVGGVMSADTDEPIWDAEYDYLLVLDAAILGGQLLGDLDWQSLVPGRDELLASMRSDLVGGTQGEVAAQAGSWPGAFGIGVS